MPDFTTTLSRTLASRASKVATASAAVFCFASLALASPAWAATTLTPAASATSSGVGTSSEAGSKAPASPVDATRPVPRRIAEAWFAHNAVLLMLGAADDIVITVARPKAFPWMYRVAPVFHHAESIDGNTMNAEELLRLKTDLVFVTPALPSVPALREAGLTVEPVSFDDFASMLDCIDQTARTLNTVAARHQADAYRRYLTQTLRDVAVQVATIPDKQRPRVLHIASLSPLKVDGDRTIVDQWIRAAGGRNAADGLTGNLKPVSMEQVLAWQPDVVILGANAGMPADLPAGSPTAALWNGLTAVQQHRVYRDPAGVFPWDRYGPEVALQVRWAAQVLHPKRAADPSLLAQTQAFYRTFFHYPLSTDEATRILAGQPPT